MPYVTTDTLKEELTEFRRRGDLRWALKGELPTEESLSQLVEALVGTGLTDDEIADILAHA